MITGETGSGKTTQVPQYILEHAAENQVPVRVVCTEPRRLAAVSVAERVALERNEKVKSYLSSFLEYLSKISKKPVLLVSGLVGYTR